MTVRKSIVRGRSVDGTVYAVGMQDGKLLGWTTSKREATRFTVKAAEDIIKWRENVNSFTEPDDVIGRLMVIKDDEVALQGRHYGKMGQGRLKS